MAELDAESLAEQVVLLGLLSREQIRAARAEAADGSSDAIVRTLLRKGLLTSWQVEKLQKGETAGFVYGNCKVLFHIAEGTFARVYRGAKQPGNQSVAVKVLRERFCAMRARLNASIKRPKLDRSWSTPILYALMNTETKISGITWSWNTSKDRTFATSSS